jgi:biopolymer transport protein ExbD
MGAQLASGTKSKQPSPDINITPLVDVVLVLLIIFMVIAPALNDGAHVEIPKVLAPDPKPKDMNPIDVTLAIDGTTVVEDKVIPAAELKSELLRMHEKDGERSLLLKTDEGVRYKKVRETFAVIQDIGFKGVLLKVIEKKKPGAT